MGFEQLATLKQDLIQKSAVKKQSKITSEKEVPVDPVLRIIRILQKHFPLAFPKNPLPKVPLKIGIHKDLIAQADELGLTASEIRAALKKWVKGKRYAECMLADAARIDLSGQHVGVVTKDEIAENTSLVNVTHHQATS